MSIHSLLNGETVLHGEDSRVQQACLLAGKARPCIVIS